MYYNQDHFKDKKLPLLYHYYKTMLNNINAAKAINNVSLSIIIKYVF